MNVKRDGDTVTIDNLRGVEGQPGVAAIDVRDVPRLIAQLAFTIGPPCQVTIQDVPA